MAVEECYDALSVLRAVGATGICVSFKFSFSFVKLLHMDKFTVYSKVHLHLHNLPEVVEAGGARRPPFPLAVEAEACWVAEEEEESLNFHLPQIVCLV